MKNAFPIQPSSSSSSSMSSTITTTAATTTTTATTCGNFREEQRPKDEDDEQDDEQQEGRRKRRNDNNNNNNTNNNTNNKRGLSFFFWEKSSTSRIEEEEQEDNDDEDSDEIVQNEKDRKVVKERRNTTKTNDNNGDDDDVDTVVVVKNDVEKLIQQSDCETFTHTESDMDAYLANELNRMSLEERQRVFEEIHGVDDVIHETSMPSNFFQEKLVALQKEIDRIVIVGTNHYPEPKTTAYELAMEQNSNYVYDDNFRLTFLRADMFDPIKAAKRLITFFECRLALFGRHALTRPLTLQDLKNDDDVRTLQSGYFQILPQRDTTGRAVLVNLQGMFQRSYKLAVNMVSLFVCLFVCWWFFFLKKL